LNKDSQSQRVLNFVAKNGSLHTKDLTEVGAARVVLTRLVGKGQLQKLGSGLYSLPCPNAEGNLEQRLAIISKKVPKAVFCLSTALWLHGLTDQLPLWIFFGMPRGSHAPRLRFPPARMVQFSGAAYTDGIVEMSFGPSTIRVYNVAKTIGDCFKHRNDIGSEVAVGALEVARVQKLITDPEASRYAKICRSIIVKRTKLGEP
jgi:predicted transcriptional regulator of viral defense system